MKVLCLGDPVWWATHYVDGRKRPCVGPCKWCATVQRRDYGYAAGLVKPRELVVVELTARTRGRIEAIGKKHGGLRGTVLELWRLGGDRRGPLELAARPTRWPAEQLPLAWDVEAFLFEQLWRVPRPLGKKMAGGGARSEPGGEAERKVGG